MNKKENVLLKDLKIGIIFKFLNKPRGIKNINNLYMTSNTQGSSIISSFYIINLNTGYIDTDFNRDERINIEIIRNE